MANHHPDAELIDRLGGPAEVARKLGFDPQAGGVQRVQNWKQRGIPEVIRLRRPDLFLLPIADTPPAHRSGAAEGDAAPAAEAVLSDKAA